MKKLLILLMLSMSTVCSAETLTITGTPDSLPQDLPLGSYSPMLEISYEGLTAQQYTLKVWLLNRGPWYCASTQWCESTYAIDNSDGLSPNGKFQIVKNMDVYNYSQLDWVARLYNASSSQVAWDENYLSGVSNRPPVLANIPDKHLLAGDTVTFQTTSSDPEGNSVTFSASNLPDGATITPEGLFSWSPAEEGEYTIIFHADDGLTYDSQEVRIDVGPMEIPEISLTSYPECGGTANIRGVVSGTDNYEEYMVITYIFIGGYGWITKPYFAAPKTPIQEDGTFEVDITTGGIDDLAEIIYVGVCRHDADIPIVAGGDLPENIPVLDSLKQKRGMEPCHRVIEWSGHSWWVKNSRGGELGPGPNVFGDSPQNVFVDTSGNLHLKIINVGGVWQCSEIVSLDTFGYGLYEFELNSSPVLDKNIVFGFFTWENDAPEEYNREIDIEFSKWALDEGENSQYVVQPWQDEANIFKFDLPIVEESSIHRFYWQPELIKFQSFFCSEGSLKSGDIIADWLFTGENIPTTSEENVRLNLWIIDEQTAPSNAQEQEIIVKSFRYRYSEELTGDIDVDSDIDGRDLAIFSATYGFGEGHPEYNSKADLYPDGYIDERDLVIFLQYYGQILDCDVNVLE